MMDGIIIGCCPTSNALLVYNPRNSNRQYYEPDSYRINSYRLLGLVYRDMKYDGGLFCSLYCNDNPPMEELYPPGTRVERIDPTSHMLLAGTVMDIPIPDDSSGTGSSDPSPSYTILFGNGTSASIPLHDMESIIPKPPVDIDCSDSQDSLLPPFLRLNSKITYEYGGQYHKGFLGKTDGIYRFLFKSHANKRKGEWGVNLPNLPTTWVDLCIEGILVPGHGFHSFLCSLSSPQQPLFNPVASLVSVVNLHRNVLPLSSKHLRTHIRIGRFGWKAIGRISVALKVSTLIVKLLWENITLLAKKVRLKPFRLCAFLPLRRMNISSLFVQSLGLWCLVTMKTAFGPKAIVSCLFSIRIPFVLSLVLRFRSVAAFDRTTVKTLSARAFFHLTKLQ
jgi:hypothetical protein